MDRDLYNEIEEEYNKVDERWLSYYFKIIVGVSCLVFILECFLGYFIHKTGFVSTTLNMFILKYIIIPLLLNGIVLLISYNILVSKTFLLETKIYGITLLSVVIFFIIYTVHGALNTLYFIFAAPIVLSAIYVKFKLTIMTSILSVFSYLFSEIFIHWDPDKANVMANGESISNFIISIFIICSFLGISLIIIYFENEKNNGVIIKEIERHHLKLKIQLDELTKTYNRVALSKAMSIMERDQSESNYTFVMIDIDNFKLLNDNFGHIEGDKCLIYLSQIMKNNCDDSQIFRYGGDEFSIIFKNYSISKIIKICESIQRDLIPFSELYNTKNNISLSFGIASYEKDTSVSSLVEKSDVALYESKKAKNSITIFNSKLYK